MLHDELLRNDASHGAKSRCSEGSWLRSDGSLRRTRAAVEARSQRSPVRARQWPDTRFTKVERSHGGFPPGSAQTRAHGLPALTMQPRLGRPAVSSDAPPMVRARAPALRDATMVPGIFLPHNHPGARAGFGRRGSRVFKGGLLACAVSESGLAGTGEQRDLARRAQPTDCVRTRV